MKRKQNFAYIPAVPTKKSIFLRLGYRKNLTILEDAQRQRIEKSIQKGLSLCQPRGGYGIFSIIEKGEAFVRLENGQALKSKSLTQLLKNSDDLVLMYSTVGPEIVDRIYKEIKEGSATLAVVLDAVASETADSCLDWLMDFLNQMLYNSRKKLTRHRYSPGYGDLPLSNQKIIFDMLNLQDLGLQLTEKCMLIPEKSVLAIAGIERIESNE